MGTIRLRARALPPGASEPRAPGFSTIPYRLLVESGGQFFAARCDVPVNDQIKPGTRVEVQGLVIERNQGVVILQGRDVKVTAATTTGASPHR